MEQWDEEALREINNLDSARLAIRGALATIRDLQDNNAALKGQNQDEIAKRRHLETKLAQFEERLLEWQKKAEQWEQERIQRQQQEQSMLAQVRSEIRIEEQQKIKGELVKTEETIAQLRSDIGSILKSQKEKEEAWLELRSELEKKELTIDSLRREKNETIDRARHDLDLVEQMRSARDREILAVAQARERELADKLNEIQALKRANDETQKALLSLKNEQEILIKNREEALQKSWAQKEKELIDRYHQRESQLQAQWSELEQGLWAKAKQSRNDLDLAVQKQFEERTRQLSDRSNEIEELLIKRKTELDEEFKRRCQESEAHYAANERRLLDGWSDKEKKLLSRLQLEVDAERVALRDEWAHRSKILENEYAQRLRNDDLRLAELERELKHRAQRLLEDAARKDAQRIRAQDEFTAQKTAELEKMYADKFAELAEKRRGLEEYARDHEERRQIEYQEKVASLVEKHEKQRLELLENHHRLIQSEKQALSIQYDERQRLLDEEYRAKVAETQRHIKAVDENNIAWKASVRDEYLKKEKDLDLRWASRETELTRNYENVLENQRRQFAAEIASLRDQSDAMRVRFEQDLLKREESLRAEYEKNLSEIRALHSRDVAGRETKHEAILTELRQSHDQALQIARDKAFADLANEKSSLQDLNNRLQEKMKIMQNQLEQKLSLAQGRIIDLETRLHGLEQTNKDMQETIDLRNQEILTLKTSIAERDRLREIDRARLQEEARLMASGELARAIEESEIQRAAAFEERIKEQEKALLARRNALETSLSERARVLDLREKRLDDEASRQSRERLGPSAE